MITNPINPTIHFEPILMNIATVLDDIDAFKRGLGNERLNLRPKYQRCEAWNKDFKEELIYSLVTHYPIGNFVFRKIQPTENYNATLEVADGQQRLETVHDLIRKGMELSPAMSRKIISENTEYFEYDLKNNLNSRSISIYKKFIKDKKANIKLTFSDFPSIIQTQILNYTLSIIEVTCSDEAIAQYFKFIQNQERLRAGEIINAMPESFLRDYLEKINNKELFLSKIKWNESRKEFDKIFYSMIGIFDQKLNFGTTDEAIINYVYGCESLSETVVEKTNRMIQAINDVTNSMVHNDYKFSKRLIKFFLLSAGLGIINYSNDPNTSFDLLCKVESKLPSFNSGDSASIEQEFGAYPQDIIDKYNLLFHLGRGSHVPKKTENSISVLRDVIEYEYNHR